MPFPNQHPAASSSLNRRAFLHTSTSALLSTGLLQSAPANTQTVELPAAHRELMQQRRRRIVVQYDANDTMWSYWKHNRNGDTSFPRFHDAVFSYADEPGSQIDAIWWDIGGSPLGCSYPSKIEPPVDHPLLKQWLRDGVDWVEQLINETRRRKLEVFWNHRISEVECLPEGGLSKEPHPLKIAHPDWVVPASWWPQGMWNLTAAGLREHKVKILRELVTHYDLDGIQIDFSRHIPCLPVGHQWELRGHVTEFMHSVRVMLLEVAQHRGRPLLLAAKVPQTLAGCHADGFDVKAWADQHLVDVLTLGSRTMDVDVEGIRVAVGQGVQLQPCVDDHHATDGYRYGSIEYLRGVFANHLQRGADSVTTFNWSIGTSAAGLITGSDPDPPSHQTAYHEAGTLQTMAGKDKFFAVERRGGYPWADGFFNRNDTAPLPHPFTDEARSAKFTLHISDAPPASGVKASLTLRCILFQAGETDVIELRCNGTLLSVTTRDPEWKDAQIFSPKPQPTSGYKPRPVDPKQRLLRLDCAVPVSAWRQGVNDVEVRFSSGKSALKIEKLEAHVKYV
ncbi:MAG: family 10 glycosylhydrolase [Verrucomicrobia bacterium]|nr:family 10 glycosylhydrolase [Verrucomicrobiota bacterium]